MPAAQERVGGCGKRGQGVSDRSATLAAGGSARPIGTAAHPPCTVPRSLCPPAPEPHRRPPWQSPPQSRWTQTCSLLVGEQWVGGWAGGGGWRQRGGGAEHNETHSAATASCLGGPLRGWARPAPWPAPPPQPGRLPPPCAALPCRPSLTRVDDQQVHARAAQALGHVAHLVLEIVLRGWGEGWGSGGG